VNSLAHDPNLFRGHLPNQFHMCLCYTERSRRALGLYPRATSGPRWRLAFRPSSCREKTCKKAWSNKRSRTRARTTTMWTSIRAAAKVSVGTCDRWWKRDNRAFRSVGPPTKRAVRSAIISIVANGKIGSVVSACNSPAIYRTSLFDKTGSYFVWEFEENHCERF
jgi:hypothetical protein